MSYTKLIKNINKKVSQWNLTDTLFWLRSIGFSTLASKFEDKAIDGSCLKFLDRSDLAHQLQIRSSITQKKLLKWIDCYFDEFDRYLEEQEKKNQKGGQKEEKFSTVAKLRISEVRSEQLNFWNSEIEKNCQTVNRNPEMADQQYVIMDPLNPRSCSVKLIASKDGFYLKLNPPLKKQVYIFIRQHIKIYHGMTLLIENSVYRIEKFNKKIFLTDSKQKKTHEIGECFSQFQLFQGTKCIIKIQKFGQNRYLMVVSDTWLSLKDKKYRITDGAKFKFGQKGSHFNFQISKSVEVNERTRCNVCFERLKDCLIVDCRHVCVCVNCCKNLAYCPACRTKISDFIRIYYH